MIPHFGVRPCPIPQLTKSLGEVSRWDIKMSTFALNLKAVTNIKVNN